MKSIICGTGSFIPSVKIENAGFSDHSFYSGSFEPIDTGVEDVITKFESLTGITERRYLESDLVCSDIAAIAADRAISDAGIDQETIDLIIVAHNFGDVSVNSTQSDNVPSLASRVKHKLGIKNPDCVAYDLIFGCPGWLQALIQAHINCMAGVSKRCLVIGAETLSRVLDPHDRDSLFFADGAGAVILESKPDSEFGILAFRNQSFAQKDVDSLFVGPSNHPAAKQGERFLKMKGRKVFDFATKNAPVAIKECIAQAGLTIDDVSRIFIHQANQKLIEAILVELYLLYDRNEIPADIMPMSIQYLGNSSVATIPTLFDLVRKGKIPHQELKTGDVIVFASVGAGMNVNAVCYKMC